MGKHMLAAATAANRIVENRIAGVGYGKRLRVLERELAKALAAGEFQREDLGLEGGVWAYSRVYSGYCPDYGKRMRVRAEIEFSLSGVEGSSFSFPLDLHGMEVWAHETREILE